uniref:FMN-dependent dehydrogenase domain-containing protein n=1 Tax=Cyprinus carpio TaxID=7962 RepID=A0A8C2J6R7_CYPCA
MSCDSAVSCRWCIYPCVLRDVSSVDMPTTVLGHRVSIPICVEATAMQRMEHPDDKTATVRGRFGLSDVIASKVNINLIQSDCSMYV